MNNVIKAVFIEMLENVCTELNDEIMSHLINAYLKADKNIGDVKFIRKDVLDYMLKEYSDFEDYYDINKFEILSDEEFYIFSKINNVFEVINDPFEGFSVEFICLDRFFASLQYTVIKAITN